MQRLAPRRWSVGNASVCVEPGDYSLAQDKRGGLGLHSGQRSQLFAWPTPPTQRSHYRLRSSSPQATMQRQSSTRWVFLVDGRVRAYSRGPDGAAAGLAYFAHCYR